MDTTMIDTPASLDQLVRIPDRITHSDGQWLIRLDGFGDVPASTQVANSLTGGIVLNTLIARYISSEMCLADRIQQNNQAINRQQLIVNIICEMFWEEATKRGWCSEAADFMEQFEDCLRQAGMGDLEVDTGTKEFTVEWTEEWHVERCATVMAKNQEEAETLVHDEHAGMASISDLQYDSWEYRNFEIMNVTEN